MTQEATAPRKLRLAKETLRRLESPPAQLFFPTLSANPPSCHLLCSRTCPD
jgi:hypothetical protein